MNLKRYAVTDRAAKLRFCEIPARILAMQTLPVVAITALPCLP
ncbi:hypothetical protein [Paenirhodobacter ferrireducens]|nr:hypothetical protein [Sinirhodobacter ferrireducens]